MDSRQDVYATLLLNDSYLPGALVLARSLRDAGTTKPLAVLVTLDNVSAEAMTALRTVYDHIVPVNRFVNSSPQGVDNRQLMGRADLHSTFTKITLWRLLQFRRIVFIDADVVALRAPDELFALPHAFAAAPDIGWPDIFNSGVMLLTPNMGDYYALQAMAERGISFDGADQGLLNTYFKHTFHRLAFTYNVTPSAHYQYLPAYKHFASSISMAHFIGKEKPWSQGRSAGQGSTPHDELVARWWAVYDRHYKTSPEQKDAVSPYVQSLVAGEYRRNHVKFALEPPLIVEAEEKSEPEDSPRASVDLPEAEILPEPTTVLLPESPSAPDPVPEPVQDTWDAKTGPPPVGSAPEAADFPRTHYSMSSDTTFFQPPPKYPDPPKVTHSEMPTKPPTWQKPAIIFPWEAYAPPATRVFPEDKDELPGAAQESPAEIVPDAPPASTRAPHPLSSVMNADWVPPPPADPWQSFKHINAWDQDPDIVSYMEKLQKHRTGAVQVLKGAMSTSPASKSQGLKLTDFPTEIERPSLPVTPAPIRKQLFWGGERDASRDLPAADGVPSQAEWDPTAKLEELARQQADLLTSKLDGAAASSRDIPDRPQPFGSEGVVSPTYIPPEQMRQMQMQQQQQYAAHTVPRTMAQPSFRGPGPAWDASDEHVATQHTSLPASEQDTTVLF